MIPSCYMSPTKFNQPIRINSYLGFDTCLGSPVRRCRGIKRNFASFCSGIIPSEYINGRELKQKNCIHNREAEFYISQQEDKMEISTSKFLPTKNKQTCIKSYFETSSNSGFGSFMELSSEVERACIFCAGSNALPSPYIQSCQFCSRTTCNNCISTCVSCSFQFCKFCITSNYDKPFDRIFCLDCQRNSSAKGKKLIYFS